MYKLSIIFKDWAVILGAFYRRVIRLGSVCVLVLMVGLIVQVVGACSSIAVSKQKDGQEEVNTC